MANTSRYRYIQFYGGRILQAREVAEMQRIQEGLDATGLNKVALDLNMIYREGASLNITPTFGSGNVVLSATNSSYPMYVFVRGRWEVLQSNEINLVFILFLVFGFKLLFFVAKNGNDAANEVLLRDIEGIFFFHKDIIIG